MHLIILIVQETPRDVKKQKNRSKLHSYSNLSKDVRKNMCLFCFLCFTEAFPYAFLGTKPQIEAWVGKRQWLVSYCPLKPRPYFIIFAHRSGTREIVPCKGIRIPKSKIFLRVKSGIGETLVVESAILGFGIWNAGQGIWIPTNDWNPDFKFLRKRIRNPAIHGVESRNHLGFPKMRRGKVHYILWTKNKAETKHNYLHNVHFNSSHKLHTKWQTWSKLNSALTLFSRVVGKRDLFLYLLLVTVGYYHKTAVHIMVMWTVFTL